MRYQTALTQTFSSSPGRVTIPEDTTPRDSLSVHLALKDFPVDGAAVAEQLRNEVNPPMKILTNY